MVASRYTRKRPSVVRTLWVNRWLLAFGFLALCLIWFIWSNNTEVTITFPLGLGVVQSTVAWVLLSSYLVGVVSGVLLALAVMTWNRFHVQSHEASGATGSTSLPSQPPVKPSSTESSSLA
ncbi:hypothetical protein Isop_0644 [Isosphaera pallida ATCC 43644]|uniref:Lipopolysaccharide assembly protein A domain-containing protein n=1 Tax=Isosphaera pallida (strain ATCC 43644 / DSM 9630 / IS1B) TaxID=575540 RepID=E8R0Q1_ISOPI|nr:hypothetical protein [Isosphaera pallida]ADV61236.1 hypothetical protein Isop_0644 [Isosphaera pallida ATCC 43644]